MRPRGSLPLLALIVGWFTFANGEGGGNGGGEGGGEGGSGESGEGGSEEGGEGGTGEGADDGKGAAKVEMTQAELDAMIEKRMARDRAKWEKDQKAQAERDKLEGEEKAKAEKAAAEEERDAAKLEALTTRVETAAERQAIAAGVKADRVTAFMRLVDIDVEDLTNDGKVDEAEVKKLVAKAIKDNPEFKPGEGDGKGGKGGSSGGDGFNNGEQKNKPKNLADAVSAKLASTASSN